MLFLGYQFGTELRICGANEATESKRKHARVLK